MMNHSESTPLCHHAIVIGGSIAGLSVARVLTNHFQHVTVIERDAPPQATLFRKGTPQARHPHVLLKGGELALEQLFPGLRQELLGQGAVLYNPGLELALRMFGRWRQPFRSSVQAIACSRPLLESALYHRLAAHPHLTFVHNSDVVGLYTDDRQTRVTGVQLRVRGGQEQPPATGLAADLVVDASGRSSHAPDWLAALGYAAPEETTVSAHPGYATRIYQRAAQSQPGWKALYLMPTAPSLTRGGIIVPLEGDRWLVNLIGMAGDYPPTDEEGFHAFARSLPDPQLATLMVQARPLSVIWGFRGGENRLRHYERLPRYLERFLVAGDAVCALNPVYGQGMTTAALSAMTIDQCLCEQRRVHPTGDLHGLAQRVQTQIGRVVAGPWQMATGADRRWATTEGALPLPLARRLLQRYLGQVLHTTLTDATVAEAFVYVQHMIAAPTSLFRPAIVLRVLMATLQRGQRGTPEPGAGQSPLVAAGE
jgi:2-polyprenyl-6-methoxyphenol hydroxylase-like FAD-dependent oxidoreductase